MTLRRASLKFTPWLLAIAFLAVQAIALTHELAHDLRQHSDASCVLHLHSKQAGGTTDAYLAPTATFAACATVAAVDTALPPSVVALGYRSRAPPTVV